MSPSHKGSSLLIFIFSIFSLTFAISCTSARVRILEDELKSCRADSERLNNALAAKGDSPGERNKGTEDEDRGAADDLRKVTDERDALRRRVDELQRQIASSAGRAARSEDSSQVAELKAKIQELEKIKRELNERIDYYVRQIANIQRERDESLKRLAAAGERIRQMERTIERLQKQGKKPS